MAVGRHFSLAKDNKHLLDIFSDDCYLELGNISNTILNKLLKKKECLHNIQINFLLLIAFFCAFYKVLDNMFFSHYIFNGIG